MFKFQVGGIAYIIAQYIEQILAPRNASLISLVTPAYAASVDLGKSYDFGKYNSLGEGLSQLIPAVFSIASVGVIFFFLIGAVRILVSGGNKESLAGARNMITHSIIGFIILMMVFLIIQFSVTALRPVIMHQYLAIKGKDSKV